MLQDMDATGNAERILRIASERGLVRAGPRMPIFVRATIPTVTSTAPIAATPTAPTESVSLLQRTKPVTTIEKIPYWTGKRNSNGRCP
jgi:hypothetical protein